MFWMFTLLKKFLSFFFLNTVSPKGPGDKFVNSTIMKAKEIVNRAITRTVQRLYEPSLPRSPHDLLALFRFPSRKAIEIATAAEVFETTIQLIHENDRESFRMYSAQTKGELFQELVFPQTISKYRWNL